MISLDFKNFVSPKNESSFEQFPFNEEVKLSKLVQYKNWLFTENNQEDVGDCPKCGKKLVIRKRKADGVEFIGCKGYPSCTYVTGYNKNQTSAARPQGTAVPQGRNPNPWYYATTIANNPNFKQGEYVALRKINDSTWEYLTLISNKTSKVATSELRSLFKSIANPNGGQYSTMNPSIEEIRELNGDVSPTSTPTTSEVDKKQYNMINDEQISEEQKEIDREFEQMMKTNSGHMMIDALAGSGKTTMLKHLAWKYGNLGQKWLYLVFNTKNKVEATDKFPNFVRVRTTNGFLGEVLAEPSNLNKIKKTDRIVVLQNVRSETENEKKLEKAKIIIDGPEFEKIMNDFKLIDKFNNSNIRIENDYEFNALRGLMNVARFSFKEQVLTLAGLAKAFALDPRDKEKLLEGLKKIVSEYDFDVNFEKVQERLEGYKDNFRSIMVELLNSVFEENFENIDFTEKIIKGTIWVLEQGMPGASTHTYERGNKTYELADYRDFNDDLWYTAIYSDKITWPKFDVVLADEVQDFNEAQKIMLRKLAQQGAKIVAVGDPNQCVIEGTLIETENGLVPIENIKVGSYVMAGKGNCKKINAKVTDVYVKEVVKKLIKITTKSGNVLTTTPEHTHFAGYEKMVENDEYSFILCGGMDGDHIIKTKTKENVIVETKIDKNKLKELYSKYNNINFVEKARLTNVTLPYIPASHVMEGMDIYISNGNLIELDMVEKVETIDYQGKVYDINVDKFHNFIANGIVTHNSLYRFRGADTNSFDNIEQELKAASNGKDVKKRLTSNFRSRKEIIDFANAETHVKDLKAGKKFKDGKAGVWSKFEKTYDEPFEMLAREKKEGKIEETAFISRTNNPLILAALKLLSNNVPFVILGKDIAKDLLKSLDDVVRKFKLRDDSPTRELESAVARFVDEQNDKFGQAIAKKDYLKELKDITDSIFATLDQFHQEKGGTSQYINIGQYKKWLNVKLGGFDIEESEKDYKAYKEKMEKEKPVVLTTAHRSKGLEFDRVFILRYDEFPHKKAKREADLAQEDNAKYVAITRAKDEVHILKLEGQPGYKSRQD